MSERERGMAKECCLEAIEGNYLGAVDADMREFQAKYCCDADVAMVKKHLGLFFEIFFQFNVIVFKITI